MDYNPKRIARLYERVYSKPPNSKEREAELAKLSDEDNAALYDYSVGLLSGRIKKTEVEEMAKQRNYEWYKKMMDSSESGAMRAVSQFSFDCPALYAEYRNRYKAEQDEERRKHNYRLQGYL